MKPVAFVVDDDPWMRDLLCDFLKILRYEAHAFSSPVPALQELRTARETPQVIISDVCMAPMGGIDFLKILRRDFPSIPVLLMSGSLSSEAKMEAVKMGAIACLTKPFSLVSLQSVLKRISEEDFSSVAEA